MLKKVKQTDTEIAPTPIRASVEDRDQSIFIAVGRIKANTIEEITEKQ